MFILLHFIHLCLEISITMDIKPFSQNESTSQNLHLSSTSIHQKLQLYSYLHSEAFYRGLYPYIICRILYNIFIPKNMVKMIFFFPGCIFWFMKRYKEISKTPSVKTFDSNVNKRKQELWTRLYSIFRFLFWKYMKISAYFIR